MFVGDLKITDIQFLDEDIFLIKLDKKPVQMDIKCGQFFNLLPDEKDGMILRRPISVGYQDEDSIYFYIKRVGKGTAAFAEKKVGETINVMGPLGNGFSLEKSIDKNVLLVGGGIGVAPLIELGKQIRKGSSNKIIYAIGFNNNPYGESFIHEIADQAYIYSVKNAEYLNGLPTDSILRIIKEENIKVIYTCGPDLMMKHIVKLIADEKLDVEVQVSLEERMGCGFGVCLCCSKIVKDQEQSEHTLCICKDGPVFDGKEVYLYE